MIYPESLFFHKDRTVVPVCFGDIFLTTYSQIFGPVAGIWEHLRSSLSANGEMEKDFAERSWAALLSVPMVPEEEVQAHRHTQTNMSMHRSLDA